MRQDRRSILRFAIGALAALWAADAVVAKDDYGLRNPAWALTPAAEQLLDEWGRTPYVRKNGRTDIFVRAQLKYGINRDDFAIDPNGGFGLARDVEDRLLRRLAQTYFLSECDMGIGDIAAFPNPSSLEFMLLQFI